MRGIRDTAGKEKKIALIWDNATYHRARTLQEYARRPDINIRLLYNVPARPDLGTYAIESAWSVAKRYYRKEIDRHRV